MIGCVGKEGILIGLIRGYTERLCRGMLIGYVDRVGGGGVS